MPQTHHHALLLLGTVAGIFPVSETCKTLVAVLGLFFHGNALVCTDFIEVWGSVVHLLSGRCKTLSLVPIVAKKGEVAASVSNVKTVVTFLTGIW